MIFSELYSVYYNAIAKILAEATDHPLKKGELHKIVSEHAFGESILTIEPAISEERWQLILPDGSTPVKNIPTMPLTTLEKRWLKSVFNDPRIKLFTDECNVFDGVEPLFTADDINVFDKYSDGDNYEDEQYIKNFRLILDAIKKGQPLKIDATNRKGSISHMTVLPEMLEYSEKDDKFRLYCTGCRYGRIINLGRIVKCKPFLKPFSADSIKKVPPQLKTVEFELVDQRNALERVLLHFAHFEKQAERLDENRYKVSVKYDKDDETEMVIRILSFGPMVRVTSPQHFVELIKERLIKQKSCGH